MTLRVRAHDASVLSAAPREIAERALRAGRRNVAGLFYATCSRAYSEEICACPICQRGREPACDDAVSHPASVSATTPGAIRAHVIGGHDP
jgi:hypothetical protein